MLSTELNRVEDLLAASRAERDDIGIKYNALSERVSHFICFYTCFIGAFTTFAQFLGCFNVLKKHAEVVNTKRM